MNSPWGQSRSPPFLTARGHDLSPSFVPQGHRIQGTAVVPGPGVHVQVPGLLEDRLVYLTRN